MVVNEAIKYHCSAPDNLCFTVKYSYQNANNYFANSSMFLLIEYCSNWCKLTMADYLVAHCLVYSTGVFQYQSVLVLAPVRCRAREILKLECFEMNSRDQSWRSHVSPTWHSRTLSPVRKHSVAKIQKNKWKQAIVTKIRYAQFCDLHDAANFVPSCWGSRGNTKYAPS